MPRSRGKIPRITFRAAKPINLSDENWRTVEAAYGRSIAQEARSQIKAVTAQFLQLAWAENTGSMNEAVQRILRLRERAQSLIAAIQERSISDAIREYADDELALTYALLNYDQSLPTRNYVSRVSLELGRFVNACNEVLSFVPKYDYWPDGGAWEVWIRQLTAILKAHQLRTGVRKDINKSKSDKASPFVDFVQSLQTFVPKQYWVQRSKDALATAISKARTESKPLVAPRKARARRTGRNKAPTRR